MLPLSLEALENTIDLLLALLFIQFNKEIRGSQVSIILKDFVLKDQMVPKRVPA
jgi:hypothetical protein